ncbi:MAG TPA: glutamate-5-semialdehyde dehydrogenase [Allocoleopsis sp.]
MSAINTVISDSFDNSTSLNDTVGLAYQTSFQLARTSGIDRNLALKSMSKILNARINDVLDENTLDLEASREMAVPELILDWLKLTPQRLKTTVEVLQRLSELSDPIRRVMGANYQLDYASTYAQLMPLGVIAFIYEALPELGAIAAGLCIKTGNCLILRGSAEASNTNKIIFEILQEALSDTKIPMDCLQLILPEQGISIKDLVAQDRYINLIIPYGRASLVKQVTQLATGPVLKSAMGNCYLYWGQSGSLEMTRTIILDSYQSQPDAVNAIEKVLINRQQKPSSITMLWHSLKEKGFQLKGDETIVKEFPEQLSLMSEVEWNQSYLNKTIAFKMVDDIEEGINWIKRYSSGHADCIVTESYIESKQFALGVDSATVYINSSPKFSRNPLGGESVFLGMSNQKGHRRGAIGIETLTTIKHIIQG